MLREMLSIFGMRAARRGMFGGVGRRGTLPFGGVLPVAAYLAWTNRDKIVSAYRSLRDRAQSSA